MKKLIYLFMLISSFKLAISASDINFPGGLEKFLIFIFETMPGSLDSEGVSVYFLKLLLFFLIFAALYQGATAVIKENNKIAGVLAFVLTLSSIIFMPNGWIVFIFETYSVIIGIGFALLPVFIGFYLNKKFLDGNESWKRVMRGMVYLFAAILLFYIAAVLEGGVIVG